MTIKSGEPFFHAPVISENKIIIRYYSKYYNYPHLHQLYDDKYIENTISLIAQGNSSVGCFLRVREDLHNPAFEVVGALHRWGEEEERLRGSIG